VKGFSCGDWGGRMDTGAASWHSVSMNWPVPACARCTGLWFDDPVGFADVDVM